MRLNVARRAFGKHRNELLSLIAALSWGCKLPTSSDTSPDPTEFRGFIKIAAFGMWSNSTAGTSEAGTETVAAECDLNGADSPSMSQTLSMHEVTTATDGSMTVSDYYGSVNGTLDSSKVSACRPTEFVSSGKWEVRIDLSQFQLPKGGTTVASGVTLPLALPSDPALVYLTAASDPLASGSGKPGCVPIAGNDVLHSGDVVGAAAQVANPRAINMNVQWAFWPIDCGASFDLAGLFDMAMPEDLATPSDLMTPLD